MTGVTRVLLSSLNWRIYFEFEAYDVEYELDAWVLGWCLIIYLLFWKSDVLFSDYYFWIPDVSWNWNHGYFSSFRIWTFLSILDWTSVQCSEMECHVESGCESWSPYGWPVRVTYSWRHVILHRKRHGEGRSFWYSFVHGRLIVDNIQYVVGKVCAFDLQFDHDTLFSE